MKEFDKTLNYWNGQNIEIKDNANKIRVAVSRYNKKNNDCFKVKSFTDEIQIIYKRIEDLEKKETLTIDEFNIISMMLNQKMDSLKLKVEFGSEKKQELIKKISSIEKKKVITHTDFNMIKILTDEMISSMKNRIVNESSAMDELNVVDELFSN
jgi:hypothetical protein